MKREPKKNTNIDLTSNNSSPAGSASEQESFAAQMTSQETEGASSAHSGPSAESSTESELLHSPEPQSAADTPSAQSRKKRNPASARMSAAAKKKKRQRIDRMISTFMVFLFFVCALVITILLLAIPRSQTSQIERRSLAVWPSFSAGSYFDGSYTSGITQYYDDTVPARDTFKNIGSTIRSLFGITSADSVEVIGNIHKAEDASQPAAEPEVPVPEEAVLTASETEPTEPASEEEETTAVESKDYHIENLDVIDENGYLVVLQDGHWRAFALYVGVDLSLYADTVNYVRQMIDPSVNIYVMPAPLAAQFYIPSNYLDYHVDMKITFQDLTSRLISGITAVDSIDVLNAHNAEPIYLRTDHHWAHLAAYYAAGEFAKAAGVPYADLDSYVENVREGYVGTMYGLTGSANLLNDPEDFVYYIPTNSYIADYYDEDMNYLFRKGLFFNNELSDSYGVALGEDDIIIRVVTDAGNGRKLLVIKDSYGNPLVPFLTSSFEEIYVIDQRYFNFNLIDYINYTGVTDVLFAHDYYSLSGAESELMEYITYSNLDTEINDIVPKPDPPTDGSPDLNDYGVRFAEEVLGYSTQTPEEEIDSEDENMEASQEEYVEEDYVEEDYAEEEYAEDTWEDNGGENDGENYDTGDTGEDWA